MPLGPFGAIVADPPWLFENRSPKGMMKNAAMHYDCLSVDEICKLGSEIAFSLARDCCLFLWATSPTLPDALRVMAAWGFTFKTIAFMWAKRSRLDRAWHMGPGYWTRSNGELVLFGTMGSPKRRSCAVRQLIVSPVREHSRKPDEIFGRIEALVGGPYLELFSRTTRPGWTVWGDEVGRFPVARAAE